MRIASGDLELNLLVDGADDAPPVLVLHGILGNALTWDWMVPRLAERFRVARLDFRGHGESDRAPGRYLSRNYVSDAEAACEALAAGPCVVIGHSLGGGTAAALAQRRPDLVRSVVLEDASLQLPPTPDEDEGDHALLDTFRLLRQMIPQLQDAGTTVEDMTGVIAASPAATGGTLGEVLADDALVRMAGSMLQVDASVLDPVLDRSIAPEVDLSQPVPVPVLAVAADPASRDAVTTPEQLAALGATSSRVEAHTLPGAGHLIHDSRDHREPFWSLIEGFLATS